METPKNSHDLSAELTPAELEVLRRRFGCDDEPTTNSSEFNPPSSGNGNDGTGGVPAPAKPPL